MSDRLIIALVGAAIGWVLSWHRFRVAENANLISDHIADMERLADALRIHWTTSFADTDVSEHKSEIAKVRALYTSIPSFYGVAELTLGTERFRQYQMHQLKLLKVGLGGDFDSLNRDLSEATAVDSQHIAWDIIQNLRTARREQYSLRAIYRSMFLSRKAPRKQHS
ncbi:hypothetical protein OCA8868_03156 [Octadecabacter ascidiaceicola]|uniref:Uncharacterized protein n=1 Tax=Octadecabacter ascidiaceicola TaxID=1655543 RepID=A0A238KQS9_9RHOB|nr:hypothetical protein OCA8868_03156 [Octadecabacter ascidiaceicola]